MGNYKKAYEYHVKFKELTDSIYNVENSTQMSDLRTNFEVEKKQIELEAISKAEKEKLTAVAAEQKKRQDIILYSVIAGLLIVLVFSFFLFQRFKITQRQKKLIEIQKTEVEKQKSIVEEQKHIVEEKQREVMDSIRYARRIQQSLLPTERYMQRHLDKFKKG
jgi:hypothetical protein